MELVLGKHRVSNTETGSCPDLSIPRFSACMNESLLAMAILEMDPEIIVTIFNNQEGLAGPAGAEL